MAYTWKIDKTDGNVEIVSTPLAMSYNGGNFEEADYSDGTTNIKVRRYKAGDANISWDKMIDAAYTLIAAFPALCGYPTGLSGANEYRDADLTAQWADFLESQNDEGDIPAYSEILAYLSGLSAIAPNPGEAPTGEAALEAFTKVVEANAQAGDEAEMVKYLKDNGLGLAKKQWLGCENREGPS